MAMAKRSTAGPCGKPCRALNEKETKLHLLLLEKEHTALKSYRLSGYGLKSSDKAAAANASRKIATDKMQSALDYHRIRRARRTRKKRDRAIERLTARVESNMADFLEVIDAEVTAEMLVSISELPFDDMQAAVRRLQQVRVIPWAEIDREKIAVISEVTQTDKGAIKYKLEPRAPAENLLAELGGWKKPKRIEVEDVTYVDALKRLTVLATAEAEAGKSGPAIKLNRQFGEGEVSHLELPAAVALIEGAKR